jgi:hypothetical protein
MGGAYRRNGEMENAHKTLVVKHEKKRPFRRPGHRWDDLGEKRREVVEHGNEPSGSIKGDEFLDKLSDY